MDAMQLVVLVSVAYLLAWVIHAFRRFADDGEDDAQTPIPQRASESSPSRAGQSPAVADSDTVVCPACGADNERGYTFCRRCVADLSAATGRGPAGRPH